MANPAPPLDPLDARLLDLVQQEIPLEPRPFRELGRRVGISEEQCLQRLRSLRDERRVIRQISAIFDTKALGYASSLVAGRYDPAHLASGAAVIGEHPGVSHNYQRNHPTYNLWYTLAVPPDSKLGFQGTLDKLHTLSGALSTRALPTLKLYKIGVKLNLSGEESSEGAAGNNSSSKAFEESDRAVAANFTLSQADRKMVVVLQQHMELVPEPFVPWAAQAGCDVATLLAAAKQLEERRQMRRFSAVLRHREAGFSANVMGVWRLASPTDAEADRCGAIMAQCPEVSHCYRRPDYEDWPFHLYTMVHAQTREGCVAVLEKLRQATGCPEYQALWSVHEFKKVRVKYFTEDIPNWEVKYA